ncbi:MAG: 2-oxoacid:acceptor oxidoreductase family protein [Candidatus Tectomicrobia bacterium]|uniref:2-oxoacid:acceptor oxidoreductase family protein n=1 Tax=Tectimicrobiota bacterium TaxID=2528274 RepID=A0A932CRF1_UNCTE|nr:2-oxoacid:acceptor oxidoreductase family protein [Candidatus Tectomicrobia bacterium]
MQGTATVAGVAQGTGAEKAREAGAHSVIFAGIGGRGVLAAGRILAEAAVADYPHVIWLPTLTTAMRGEPCECTLVLSPQRIASVNVWRPDALVILDPSRLKVFEGRVRPGGLIITETAGLEEKERRADVQWIKVPALEMAIQMGNPMMANLILLGIYVGKMGVVPPEAVEAKLEKKFGGREMVSATNREAFRQGIELARDQLGR